MLSSVVEDALISLHVKRGCRCDSGVDLLWHNKEPLLSSLLRRRFPGKIALSL